MNKLQLGWQQWAWKQTQLPRPHLLPQLLLRLWLPVLLLLLLLLQRGYQRWLLIGVA